MDLHGCDFPKDSLVVQKSADYVSVNDIYTDSSFHTTVLKGTDTLFHKSERFYWQQPSVYFREFRESCFAEQVKMTKLNHCGSTQEGAQSFGFHRVI